MNSSRNNPFFLIIICMVLLLLSQTLVAFGFVFLEAGDLFQQELTYEQVDALMLDIMYANQTQILLVSYGVVLVVLWIMARRRQQSFRQFSGLDRPAKLSMYVLAFWAGLAAAFWATIAVNLIPWPAELLESYQQESGALTTSKPVLDFLAVVLAGPIVEEMIFRGIIYDAFCTFIPAGAAVLFQGMLFGSVHGTVIWMSYALFMGCVLGYVRKRTGSLRPCILMHMAFNGASYLFDWFANRYGDDQASITFMFIFSAFVLLLSMYGISFRTDKEKN